MLRFQPKMDSREIFDPTYPRTPRELGSTKLSICKACQSTMTSSARQFLKREFHPEAHARYEC